MPKLPYRTRMFLIRAVNVVRPRPQVRPLSPEQVLEWSASSDLVQQFNAFYAAGMSQDLVWRGVTILKNPCDMWMVAELIQRLRPTAIVETGTHHGGSATFYADIASIMQIDCDVITVDFNPKWEVDPRDRGIHSLVGYSTDTKTFAQVSELVRQARDRRAGHVLAILDSDHSEENVTEELRLYAPLVTTGSYVVVEDTNVPGAYAATSTFLAGDDDFERDRSCERFLLTFHPGGWLRRTQGGADVPAET